jgi:hypothetical protein
MGREVKLATRAELLNGPLVPRNRKEGQKKRLRNRRLVYVAGVLLMHERNKAWVQATVLEQQHYLKMAEPLLTQMEEWKP